MMRMQGLKCSATILAFGAVLMVGIAPVHARRSTASIFTAVDANKDGTVDEAIRASARRAHIPNSSA